MADPSTLLDPAVPLDQVQGIVAETWQAVQTGEHRLCLGLRRLFRNNAHRGSGIARFADRAEFACGRAPFEKYDLRDGTFLGWGFDPERFERGDPHVGTGRKEGDRAPPGPESRREEPA